MHPRLQEIEHRLAAIRQSLATPEADLAALEAEIEALTAERRTITEAIEKRQQLIAAVAAGPHPVIARAQATHVQTPEKRFDADSPEYRSAWYKSMAHDPRTGEWRLGELTDIEKRAFTYTTANTPAVIPGALSLGIESMIGNEYALLRDITPTSIKGVIEFSQAKSIIAGAAGVTNENTANEDLQVDFDKVEMTGVEMRASAVIGAKMRIVSVDGFEAFLADEIGRGLGEVMNRHVAVRIEADLAVANAVAGAALTDALIRQAFGLIKGGRGARNVYASGATIWSQIAGVVDEEGKKLFVATSLNDDPTLQGYVYGSRVKLDDTLPAGLILVGYPARVKANTFEAPNVLADLDVKTRAITYGGYALFEARLADTRSWASITIA